MTVFIKLIIKFIAFLADFVIIILFICMFKFIKDEQL